MHAAAQNALHAHDELRNVGRREPDSDEQAESWVLWYDLEYRAAYDEWDRAMNELQASGYAGGRHPLNFRPWCEQVLDGD